MNTIFSIIKSLSKSEKRIFKMHSKLQSGDKKYLQLFDILDKLEEYDEGKLLLKLRGYDFCPDNHNCQNMCSHLRATASYLRKQLLRSLRTLHERNNKTKSNIEKSIKNAEIFLNRGFKDGFEKELKHAKAIASELEWTVFLLEINRLYIAELPVSIAKRTIAESNRLHEECASYIEILRIQNIYSKIFHQLFIAYRKGYRYSQNEIDLDKIIQVPELNLSTAQQNFHIHQLYYIILGFYELLKNELSDALDYFKQSLDVWKANSIFTKERPMIYQAWISNYLNLCSIIGKYDKEYKMWFKELQKIPTKNRKQTIERIQNTLQLEFLYLINEGDLDEASSLIEDIENTLVVYQDEIPQSKEVVLKYNLMILQFIQSNYYEAMNLAIEIELMPNSGHRQDLQAKAKAFNLIFLFEQGFYKRLAQIEEGTKTYFIRHKQYNDLNKLLRKHLRLIAFSISESSQRGMLFDFRGELYKLKAQIGLNNIGGLGIEEVEYWLESKIDKIPMKQVIENRRRLMME